MPYPISRYLNVQMAYLPSFSGNGRYLSFLSNATGMPQAWRIDLEAAAHTIPWPDQVTFAVDRVMSAKFSPVRGDNRLFFTHDIGGNENAQMFLLNLESGEETALSTGFEEALHIPGEWSTDGRYLLFAANRRHPGQFDLYHQPMSGGAAELLWQHEEPGYLHGQRFSPNGQRVALIRMARSADHDLLEVDLGTGQVRQLNPPDKTAQFMQLAYSKDGRFLFTVTDLDSDYLHVARLDLATLAWEKLVTPNWDVELMALSRNGRYLAYSINENGRSKLELIDMGMGVSRPAPLPEGAPGLVGWFDGLLEFSPDSRHLAFSYTSATRTSDIYLWNLGLDDDTVQAVTRMPHGGIPTDRFVAPELIHYPTFDGRQIPAWLYKPAAATSQTLPVVVMVHGGPESQFRPYFNFLAEYLVHNGYAVLAPNVRGSTGYGRAYSHLDDVEKRMDSVADLAHAAYWLKAQPAFDGERIAVYGGSYGGFMVLSALTTYPDLWAAGVDIVGISNFVTFLENTSEYRRSHRESEYGSLAQHRDFLQSISPLNQVKRITAPLMVIHGANDPRVPLSEAEQLVAALEKRGVPVEFLVFDDEGHGLAKLKNKEVAYPAIIQFFNRFLH